MLRIAKFDRYDLVNNPGDDKASSTSWFGGCSVKCKNCHNPELQAKDKGEIVYTIGLNFKDDDYKELENIRG